VDSAIDIARTLPSKPANRTENWVRTPFLVGWKQGRYHVSDKKRKQVFTLPGGKIERGTFRERNCTNSSAEDIPFCGDLPK
jgi:hypothetical protein